MKLIDSQITAPGAMPDSACPNDKARCERPTCDECVTAAPLPMMQFAEGFGDPETLFNSRDWLKGAIEAKGAKINGGGAGLGQCDLDFTLDGCKFNVSLRPILAR